MNTVKYIDVKDKANTVQVRGNLTRDPELRTFSNGTQLCKFGVGINRTYKNANGEDQQETTFIDVDYYGADARDVSQFLVKGTPVAVLGTLKQDNWEDRQTGEKRSKLLINGAQITEVLYSREPAEGQTPREPTGFHSQTSFEELKNMGIHSNSVQLIGNLTADPEISVVPSGDKVANFSLGVNHDKNAPTVFVSFSTFDKDIIADLETLKKGDQLAAEGCLKQDRWENDKGKQSRIKVMPFEISKIEKQAKKQYAEPEAAPLPQPREKFGQNRARSMAGARG